MKSKIPIILLFFFQTIYSQIGTEWVGVYSRLPQSHNYPNDIVSDSNNNIFVTGFTRNQGYGSEKFVIIKYSPTGNQEWVKILPGFGIGKSIAIDRNGYVIAGGEMKDTFSVPEDYCVVKLDQNGNIQWLSRYDGPLYHYDYGEHMIIDSNNNIYITGISSDTVTYYATVKYNTNGIQQWAKRYKFRNGGGLNTPVRLALDNIGNLYLAAHQLFNTTYEDYLLIKYDNNGNQLWSRNYNSQVIQLIIVSVFSRYCSMLFTGSTNAFGMFTCKYDPEGV
jgi:hypothetical protein